MDNQCIFFSYIVKGDPSFNKTSTGKEMIRFQASSIRPNKSNLWNKNLFTAFGETAAHLNELLQKGTVLDIVAEQQCYEKGGSVAQNYLVRDFTIKKDRKPKEGTSSSEGSSPEEVPETTATAESSESFSDYEKMMSEFV